jgi:SNF2 family DNA or RNA helicase
MQIPQRVGDEVRVRRSRWRVVAIDPHEDCTLLTLTGIGPHNLGDACQILAPFDRIEPIERPRRLRVTGMRPWRAACRSLLWTQGLPDEVHATGGARIDPLAFQLEPTRALLAGEACRILIADDVGLGKTIQAAIAIAELRARGEIARVLILTPAGLREQWRDELSSRFGLQADVVDARAVRLRSSRLPIGVNPWATVALAIASTDYIKRPEVLPALTACRWDLVVIDEAHNAAVARDRHDAVATLCARAAYVILLTATPHCGDPSAFAALGAIGALGDPLITFRRTRQSVGLGGCRRVHCLSVRPSSSERLMHAALARFGDAVRRDRGHDNREAFLGLSVLQKRAYSSASALERTIARRLAGLGDPQDSGRQMGLPLDDGEGEFDSADLDPSWTVPALVDVEDERRLLTSVLDAAHEASARESKIQALARLVGRLTRRGERAIVFTEYRDTLQWIARHLQPGSLTLHGGLTREERRAALGAFTSGQSLVLLATDAAGEGLNLHHACRAVINLELPWNPVRLEQRAGRVDRIGQRRTVHAFHLIASGVGEEQVLERLKSRIARAQSDIDTRDPLR